MASDSFNNKRSDKGCCPQFISSKLALDSNAPVLRFREISNSKYPLVRLKRLNLSDHMSVKNQGNYKKLTLNFNDPALRFREISYSKYPLVRLQRLKFSDHMSVKNQRNYKSLKSEVKHVLEAANSKSLTKLLNKKTRTSQGSNREIVIEKPVDPAQI